MPLSQHTKRVFIALIALPLFYLYITKLPAVFFLFILAIVMVLAQIEFHAMYKTKKSISLLGIASGILLILSALNPSALSPLNAAVIAFILISSARLFLIKDPAFSLKDIAPAIIGFLYIPNLLLSQWHLRMVGHEWIVFLYACVWTSDSFAYYIGKGIGKRRLYKEVSPNKTIEGALGSVFGGIFSALIIGGLMIKNVSISSFILIGGAVGAITIVGDLVESMFKRDAGVKDSGSLIPGHGGVLDKIDGVLFAGPLLYGITLIL